MISIFIPLVSVFFFSTADWQDNGWRSGEPSCDLRAADQVHELGCQELAYEGQFFDRLIGVPAQFNQMIPLREISGTWHLNLFSPAKSRTGISTIRVSGAPFRTCGVRHDIGGTVQGLVFRNGILPGGSVFIKDFYGPGADLEGQISVTRTARTASGQPAGHIEFSATALHAGARKVVDIFKCRAYELGFGGRNAGTSPHLACKWQRNGSYQGLFGGLLVGSTRFVNVRGVCQNF